MTNDKREQIWESENDASRKFFQDSRFILGTRHLKSANGVLESEECGPNCTSRKASISCPYFKETVPCLVGTEVQQQIGTPDDGLGYDQLNIKVISQSGRYLIGEEVIINLDNPRASFLRVLKDKYGVEVNASPSSDISLFDDMEQGVLISEVKFNNEQSEDNKS